MNIKWQYVKEVTQRSYEELIAKLALTLDYQFVQQNYNHTMDEAIDYVGEIHAGYLQNQGNHTQLDSLITNFNWLKRVNIQNYLDLVYQVDNRGKCEKFLSESGFGFAELIETFNYLFRWVLPFPTPLREFVNADDATQMAYIQSLKQQQITNNLDLLERGRTVAMREWLATVTGIPCEYLLRLTHQSDLARLAYVRGKTVKHLCGSGFDTLAKLASVDPQEAEAAMNRYFQAQGKRFANFKSAIPLARLVGGATILPKIVETV